VPTSPVHNRVSRFTADPSNPDSALPGSEAVIIELDNLTATNHNGGAIHFGSDGKLYVAVGDNAVPSNAQNLGNLLGKMLRLNPDGSIPPDNPFVTTPGARGEIWAAGFRNPFTFAVQPGTGRIYVNDVGSGGASRREEVNNLIKSGNFGWPTYEGYTNQPGFQSPVFAYDSNFGGGNCSIAGGAFYNPATSQFPSSYTGKYFFADLCGNWIYTIDPSAADPKSTITPFATDITSGTPVDLKIGPDGSLYMLLYGGLVFRVSYYATSTALVSSLSEAAAGTAVTFTATVSMTDPTLGTPSGSVTFFDRGIARATVALSAGIAQWTTSSLTPGNHLITAGYDGNPPYLGSTSNAITQFIQQGQGLFAIGGQPGLVQVRRTSDGSELLAFSPYGIGYTGPVSVALGDINNDGYEDLVTGALVGNPDVRVFDGMKIAQGPFDPDSGRLAQWFAYGLSFNIGVQVAVGDVNADGFADIVTGASLGNPAAHVYDGRDLAEGAFHPNGASLLQSFFAFGLNFNIGTNVSAADVDGDGCADVIASANKGNPEVRVFRGRDIADGTFSTTSSLLADWFAFGVSFNIGAFVTAGDVNNDGFVDVITGATAGNPHVRVYDGRDFANRTFNPQGSVHGEFFAYDLQFNVGVAIGAADFDGDGQAEILTGASVGSSHFRVVKGNASGVKPSLVNGIEGIPAEFSGGIAVGA
jgi:hypothetical protein